MTRVKSPITLAAEMLRRGNDADAGGAQGHVHVSGAECERLAEQWGLELCDPSWFWTRKRWQQHLHGGEGIEPPPRDGDGGDDDDDGKEKEGPMWKQLVPDRRPDGTPWPADDPAWDLREYIPKGTVGCVVMDHTGTLAVATSTGGLTNKLPGRIGDTPTFGAGFWAEEWMDSAAFPLQSSLASNDKGTTDIIPLLAQKLSNLAIPATSALFSTIRACISGSGSSSTSNKFLNTPSTAQPPFQAASKHSSRHAQPHAVALGGTGNGDSFLRLSAASAVASAVKFNAQITAPHLDSHPADRHGIMQSHRSTTTLQTAISYMADPDGQLQQSAGARWGGPEGEGEGGQIGIEMVNGEGKVCFGFNRAMWRAWIDDQGEERCMVFRGQY